MPGSSPGCSSSSPALCHGPGGQWRMAQVLGPLHPHGRQRSTWLLASDQRSAGIPYRHRVLVPVAPLPVQLSTVAQEGSGGWPKCLSPCTSMGDQEEAGLPCECRGPSTWVILYHLPRPQQRAGLEEEQPGLEPGAHMGCWHCRQRINQVSHGAGPEYILLKQIFVFFYYPGYQTQRLM